MNREFQLLGQLETHAGYKYLEELWRDTFAEIQEKRDKAAQRGQESAWRYWAGVEKGFRLATMQLHEKLIEMEKEEDNERAEERFEAIAQSLNKGESNGS